MVTTIPNRADWFEEDHGFPHPNWEAINGWMRVHIPEKELDAAWQQVVRHWLGRLRDRMGNGYDVAESENFVLLIESDAAKRAQTIAFLEKTRAHIYRVLGDLREPQTFGKHVVMRFSETNDYYAYISHFHIDGEYAESGGCFLAGGYGHIAYPKSWSEAEESKTLVHELTHDLLVHLPLPAWLNEALAMAFESEVGGQQELLTRELARRHREYWNEKTIQQFWSGASFSDVEGQELSYSLSRVLLDLVRTELRPSPDSFRKFVLRADWTDAGAVAVREHLDEDIENLVATFLGPGDWSPKRKEWKRRSVEADDKASEFEEAEQAEE